MNEISYEVRYLKTLILTTIIYILLEYSLNISTIYVNTSNTINEEDIITLSKISKLISSIGISLLLFKFIIEKYNTFLSIVLCFILVGLNYVLITLIINTIIYFLPFEWKEKIIHLNTYKYEIINGNLIDNEINNKVHLSLIPMKINDEKYKYISKYIYNQKIEDFNNNIEKEIDVLWSDYKKFNKSVTDTYVSFIEHSKVFHKKLDLPGTVGYWGFKNKVGVRPDPNISKEDFFEKLFWNLNAKDMKKKEKEYKSYFYKVSDKEIKVSNIPMFLNKEDFKKVLYNYLDNNNISPDNINNYDKIIKVFLLPFISITLSLFLIIINVNHIIYNILSLYIKINNIYYSYIYSFLFNIIIIIIIMSLYDFDIYILLYNIETIFSMYL